MCVRLLVHAPIRGPAITREERFTCKIGSIRGCLRQLEKHRPRVCLEYGSVLSNSLHNEATGEVTTSTDVLPQHERGVASRGLRWGFGLAWCDGPMVVPRTGKVVCLAG